MGRFIQPDTTLYELKDPAAKLGVPIISGTKAFDYPFSVLGKSAAFDALIVRAQSLDLPFEDQCSAIYYLELWQALHTYGQTLKHIVEVGVYMGGCSTVLAEYIAGKDCTLDLVDNRPEFLLFTYERIRRQCPEAVSRVRLYCGSLPEYVSGVLLHAGSLKTFIHHDGAHNFLQVVKDLSAISFVRDRVTAIALQDTHLRGIPEMSNFVDMAIYAVFGLAVKYVSIGAVYEQSNTAMMNPNNFEGNYFMPGIAEGWIIPLAPNSFRYPHPSITLEQCL